MKQSISTIGYEGATIENFIATLQGASIDVLIDVRDVPLSRKKGFSKSQLAQILSDNGVGYIHLKGLGDPKAGREAARAGNFALFGRIYDEHLKTAIAITALQDAAKIVREQKSCLMCFEADPRTCHRTIVAARLANMTGLTINSLYARGTAKLRLAA